MKVLIVDDALMVRKQMTVFMEKEMKAQVVVAADGEEAVQMYKQHRPDLVTLDITMPIKDGVAALEEIMTFDSDAKVLMVSAVKGSANITKALQMGAKGYIKKPLAFDSPAFLAELKEDIEDVLDG